MCAALVTSSVRGVTRGSTWDKGLRVPAYTRFAPLLKASSTSACPIPRLAPVIKTDLSAMFITFSFTESPSEYRATKNTSWNPFLLLPLVHFRKVHISGHLPVVSLCPAAHASKWSDDCLSQWS